MAVPLGAAFDRFLPSCAALRRLCVSLVGIRGTDGDRSFGFGLTSNRNIVWTRRTMLLPCGYQNAR